MGERRVCVYDTGPECLRALVHMGEFFVVCRMFEGPAATSPHRVPILLSIRKHHQDATNLVARALRTGGGRSTSPRSPHLVDPAGSVARAFQHCVAITPSGVWSLSRVRTNSRNSSQRATVVIEAMERLCESQSAIPNHPGAPASAYSSDRCYRPRCVRHAARHP